MFTARLHLLSQVDPMVHGEDDASLLEAVHSGSPEAARMLYDRFARDVNRVVWRVLGADSEHDDVVQQVFANVFRNLNQVADPERLRSWVVSVTVRTVRKEIRYRKVRSIVQLDPEPIARASEIEDHEARALVRRVHAILDQLPANLHVAFVLRYVEGRALLEVAELCGCSLATIKRRLRRAKQGFEQHAKHDPDLAARLGPLTKETSDA